MNAERTVQATLVLLIAGALLRQHETMKSFAAANQLAEAVALRQAATDRLVGIRLPLLFESKPPNTHQSGTAGSSPALYWIVNPGICRDCFGDAGHWNSLAASGAFSAGVVMLDLTEEAAHRIAERSHLRGTILTMPSTRLSTMIGMELPASTKLLLDGDGTVLLVDARISHARCQWYFEGLVGRLLRVGPTLPVRPL